MNRTHWTIIGVAFLMGCAVALFPVGHAPDVVNPSPLAWEPWHRQAWDEVSACVGKPQRFPRGVTLWVADGMAVQFGIWWPHRKRIYLRRDAVSDTGVLKHEFVHILEDKPYHGPLFREWSRCRFAPHLGIIGK